MNDDVAWFRPVCVAARRRRARGRSVELGLMVLLAGAVLLAVAYGALALSPFSVLRLLVSPEQTLSAIELDHRALLVELRLPRVVLALAVGAALGASGAAVQGLFRNPLADPGLLGISSGAALFASGAIVAGSRLDFVPAALRFASLPLAAFFGSLLASLLVFKIAARRGAVGVERLLLAGIAVNALAGAGTGLLTVLASEPELRSITFWMFGSLGAATWPLLLRVLPPIALALCILPGLARAFDALALGEAGARHLGISVENVKRVTLAASALAVGAAVAVSGVIGFVGLVAPHLVRLAIGGAHRPLLIGSALLGALLLVLADLGARTVSAPAEVPVGIVTALLGAPFFLLLLARRGADR